MEPLSGVLSEYYSFILCHVVKVIYTKIYNKITITNALKQYWLYLSKTKYHTIRLTWLHVVMGLETSIVYIMWSHKGDP